MIDSIQKTAVVTGATSGIGLAAVRLLAARGWRVIGVGRTASRCAAVEEVIRSDNRSAVITYRLADLASQQQIRELGAALREEMGTAGRLDLLVHCAGTVANWYTGTEDGFELQFAVNHLAPFRLTYELLPLLAASKSGRVITVSSGSHYHTRMHWNDLMFRKHYHCLFAYKQAKLANVLFTAELNRRIPVETGVRALAVDPGLVNTEIGLKGTTGMVKWFWDLRRRHGVAPEHAARTIEYLAVTERLPDPEAIYWKECHAQEPSKYSQDPAAAARLWEISARLCGVDPGYPRSIGSEVAGTKQGVIA